MRYIEIDARELLWNKEALDFYNYLSEKVQDHPAGKKYLEKYFKNKILNNELVLPIATKSEYKKAPAKSKNPYAEKALDNNELYLVKFDDSHKRLFTELFDYICTLDKNKPINIPYQEISKVVQEYHKKFQSLKQEKEDIEGLETLYEFKNGYRWVSITSKQGLKRESSLMQHCVGEDPQYWNKIKDKKILILSLRDKQNKPHITIEYEIKRKTIRQVQGKQDKPPIQKYVSPYLEFLLLNTKSPIKHKEKFENNKFYYGMQYQNKHFYSPFDLPENFTWNSDLDLSYSEIKNLPKGLRVKGNLSVSFSKITKLPDDLKIDGNLLMSATDITSLPKELKVDSLYATLSKLLEIPKNFKVRHLVLCNTDIKSLPEGLEVTENLDISGSKITKLPKNLKIGGNFILNNTPLKSLPEGLEVGGRIELENTYIKKLSENIKIGGSLSLVDSKVVKLPKKLEVGGDLYLDDLKILEIPNGLKVGGDVSLGYSDVIKLPDNWKVKGDLDIHRSKITSLPKGLEVDGDLDLRYTDITEIPKDLKVKERLFLSKDKTIKIPKDLKVGQILQGY